MSEAFALDLPKMHARFSLNELDSLQERLESQGFERAFVVCGPGVAQESDVLRRTVDVLGELCVGTFQRVEPHAPLDVVNSCVEAARAGDPDVVVSVGGGSTIDTCKGVSLLYSTDAELRDFCVPSQRTDSGRRLNERGEGSRIADASIARLPIIAIPTTMGCAEFSKSGGGFLDAASGEKILVDAKFAALPAEILVDGNALATTPVGVQRATAMGQFRIAIESFLTRNANAFSDALALHAAKRIVELARSEWEWTPETLLDMKIACAVAHTALLSASTLGLATSITHHLASTMGAPHAEVNAVMLRHVFLFNAESVTTERLSRLAGAVAPDEQNPLDRASAVAAVNESLAWLGHQLGMPQRLRDLLENEPQYEQLVPAILRDRHISANPREIREAREIRSVIEAAW